MWNPFKKSKEQHTEYNEYQDTREYTACVNAEFIYRKIYCLFKERINELKEGDNFILLQEEPIKICDNKDLNESLIHEALYNINGHLCSRIPELRIVYGKEIKVSDDVSLGYEKYYLYTIKISHDDTIELYDIKFKVHPSPQEINNGNEICVTVHSVDKTIYKLILLNNYEKDYERK